MYFKILYNIYLCKKKLLKNMLDACFKLILFFFLLGFYAFEFKITSCIRLCKIYYFKIIKVISAISYVHSVSVCYLKIYFNMNFLCLDLLNILSTLLLQHPCHVFSFWLGTNNYKYVYCHSLLFCRFFFISFKV